MRFQKQVVQLTSICMAILAILTGIIFTIIETDTKARASQDSRTDTNITATQSSDTEYGILGVGDALIKSGEKHDFLDNISPLPKQDDWTDGEEFRVIVTSVDSESDASYTYKQGDTSFTPDKNDDGKTYIVHYKLQRKQSGNNDWADLTPSVTATKKLQVYTLIESRDDTLDNDTYIGMLQVENIADGAGPWDADDEAGNDSNDSNGIVRTFDTITYNISYATRSVNTGNAYKNAWIGFEFFIPYKEQEATFDTTAMNWMSTDTTHKWTLTKGTDGQTLRCWKRVNGSEGNTVVPGTGSTYLTLRIYAMQNGASIAPTIKSFMPGNETNGTISSGEQTLKTGDSPQALTINTRSTMISCVPSYNVFLYYGSYQHEVSGIFDFSTGTDNAPNKSNEKIRGRLVKYGVNMELRNKLIADGPDKGKAKRLMGIEIPTGPITYDIKLDTSYLDDNGKKYELSGEQYTPKLWSYAPNTYDTNNTSSSFYNGRSLAGLSPTNGNGVSYYRRSMDNEGCKNIDDGLPGTSKGVWNNGDTTITQHGDTLSVTISNYEINPRWFPASLQHAYQDSNDYWDQKAGVWQTNRGVFTCQNLYIVVPFGEGDDYLPKKFGISGTIRLTLTDENLQASGLSGQKLATVSDSSNQSVITDDTYTEGVYISRSGSYTNKIWYSSRQSAGAYCGSGTYPDKENFNHGSDAVMIGGDVTTNTELICDAQGDQKNIVQGVDVLIKYSTKCFIPDKSVTSYYSVPSDARDSNSTVQLLWATKKDGTGWLDDDEMNSTREEDLFYYESLNELETSGKTCVGVLGTFRNPYSQKVSQGSWKIVSFLKAKNDDSLVGEVGAIVVESNAWRRYKNSDLEQAPEVPTRIDIQNGTATEEQFDCESRKIKTNRQKYIKAEYDADGNFCEHTSGTVIGDSMLLTSYTSKISVGIDQIGDDGTRKKTYDLDNNQYTVDYTIKPSIPTLPVGTTSRNTNVYITATLPEGLDYKLGSSTLDGTYLRSAIAGGEGKVDNGTPTNPTVEKTKNGVQLKWTIQNVDITKPLPTLRFKARIASSTQRNTIFTLTASVQTDEDHRAPNASYGNESSIEINTSRTTDLSLQTAPKKIMNESSSGITYDLQYTNNGSKTLTDKIFLVIMPTNEDGNSKYNGTYTLRTAKLEGMHAGYKAYYTTNKNGMNVTTKTTDGLTSDGIRSGTDGNCTWIEATINDNGMIDMPNSDVTAWCVIGDLPNGSPVKMVMSILPTENQSGDRYTEQIWIDNSTAQASAYVARRIIDGTCWIDWNANGKLDANEKRISGIKVKLLYADSGTQVTNGDGVPFETITDDSGNYRFDGLPYGTFRISFESGDKLVGYNLSPKNASNVSTALSSKADGTSDDCLIDNVNMPESSKITYSPYLIQYQNVGFVPIINLPFTGTTITPITIGWMTLICWCIAGAIGGFIIGRRFQELGTKENHN